MQVGDKKIKTSRIKPGVSKFISFRVSEGVRQPLSILTRTIKIERKSGAEVIIVEQQYESANGVSVDTSILQRQTLSPISYTSKPAAQTESFDFTQTGVAGTITTTTGENRQMNVLLKEPVFNAVVQNEILQSLPLEKGKNFSFRIYNPGKQFFEMTALVGGSETIKTINGNVEAWIVSIAGAAAPTKIWMSKKTQEVIWKKTELPNGDEFWQIRIYQ